MNRLKWIWFVFIFLCLTGCKQEDMIITSDDNGESLSKEENQMELTSEVMSEEELIYVYVCGHVVHPGVYSLQPDARIVDALELAGGITEDGNPIALDQAACMTDGMTLYVPGMNEMTGQETDSVTDDGLVNINTADKETLMTIPGIGESKADAIISYRNEYGNFSKVEDLMNISGIKEGVFNKIKAHVKVVN